MVTDQLPSQGASQALAELAQRLGADSAYMASVLRAFQAQERLDAQGLASLLGISVAGLTRLALCKRPPSEGSHFAAQTRQIASFAGVDAAALAQLIRQVDALEATNAQPMAAASEVEVPQPRQNQLGWLAAARDRTENDEEQNQSDQEEPQDQEGDEA